MKNKTDEKIKKLKRRRDHLMYLLDARAELLEDPKFAADYETIKSQFDKDKEALQAIESELRPLLETDNMVEEAEMDYDYDVALSFAGEDREYVETVAEILHQLGVKVFYDKYEEADLWGKDLYTHLDSVYQKKSRYCVMFISNFYKEKLWTNHERESAQARAFIEKQEYILPVRFDDTEIPGIRPTTGYIDLRHKTPSDLAYLIAEKIGIDVELKEIIALLKYYLHDYEISIDGTDMIFDCKSEDFHGEFPVRLMIEMYRMDLLVEMFIYTSVVPN